MDFSVQDDLEATLRKIMDLGADGLILWGSSDDINTKQKCVEFKEYVNNELGPIVDRIRRTALGLTQSNSTLVDNRIDVSVDQVWRSTWSTDSLVKEAKY